MKALIFLLLLPVILLQIPFGSERFYRAFASEDTLAINDQLRLLDTLEIKSLPFRGALLMRKAGLVSVPREKLNLFREGKKMLEEAIAVDSLDPELRFLRLVVQENSPPILQYKNRIGEDAELIRDAYPGLPPRLKKAVEAYSRQSKALSGF